MWGNNLRTAPARKLLPEISDAVGVRHLDGMGFYRGFKYLKRKNINYLQFTLIYVRVDSLLGIVGEPACSGRVDAMSQW